VASRRRPRKLDRACTSPGRRRRCCWTAARRLIRIGERLNVRGSKKVREAVENETGIDHDVLEEVVHEQVAGWAAPSSTCAWTRTRSIPPTLKEVVHEQTKDFSGAMCIDSFEPEALAEAIKVYPGRPIINSISMEEVSPGVSKIRRRHRPRRAHDPLYVGLCADAEGPGATARREARPGGQIIVARPAEYGVAPSRSSSTSTCFPLGSESVRGHEFRPGVARGIRLVKDHIPDLRTTVRRRQPHQRPGEEAVHAQGADVGMARRGAQARPRRRHHQPRTTMFRRPTSTRTTTNSACAPSSSATWTPSRNSRTSPRRRRATSSSSAQLRRPRHRGGHLPEDLSTAIQGTREQQLHRR
jgi:hypothetical protein